MRGDPGVCAGLGSPGGRSRSGLPPDSESVARAPAQARFAGTGEKPRGQRTGRTNVAAATAMPSHAAGPSKPGAAGYRALWGESAVVVGHAQDAAITAAPLCRPDVFRAEAEIEPEASGRLADFHTVLSAGTLPDLGAPAPYMGTSRNLERRTTLKAAGASAVALGLAAAAGCGGESGFGGGVVTIRYSWWGAEERAKRINRTIALFEKKYPKIKVKTD